MKSLQIKTLLSGFGLIVLAVGLMSLTSYHQQKPWVIDAKYKAMKNPVKSDAASVAAGKTLWIKNCASCHGKTGLGDGVKARIIDTSPGDFSKAAFQSMSDGEIYGKTLLGKGDMPKYQGKISDNDVWNIVNFTRTLKK